MTPTASSIAESASALPGARSPMVGRDAELRELGDVIARAMEFHAPHWVTVVGNQGTGKSRLVAELAAATAAPVRVVRAAATPGGPRYGVVAQLLRERLGLPDGESAERARGRLRAAVEQTVGDARVAEMAYFLGVFLDLRHEETPLTAAVADDPAQVDAIASSVLRRFIEVDAAAGPMVLVFDDLQWADEDTLRLLGGLGAHLGGSPVVLVTCARPEMLVRHPSWGEGATEHLRIELRNLPGDDAGAMLRHLLAGCDGVSADVIDEAVEQTGGNPRFLEDLVKLFLSNGTVVAEGGRRRLDPERAAATELPIGIEEAIEARIAALDGGARELLAKAVAFGNVFWVGGLVALTRVERQRQEDRGRGSSSVPPRPNMSWDWSEDEPIRRTVRAQLDGLVEHDYLMQLDPGDSTIAGELELLFKHNLERDLIARSTDPIRLAAHQRVAAQWLETKVSAHTEEQLELIAQLYERGGDRRAAALCYTAAGDKARTRYARAQAVDFYARGLALLGDDDTPARLETLHNLGDVLDVLGRTDEALGRFSEMLRTAWLFDHRAKAGAAHDRLGRIYRRRGEYDRALEHLREANLLFQQAADRRGVAGTLDDIGQVHWLRGGYAQALELHRQALSIRRALGDRRSIALSLANIGRVLHDSGAFKAAMEQFREALDLRRDAGDQPGVVQSLCDLAAVHSADGNYTMALELCAEAQGIATSVGDQLALAQVLARTGECKAALGHGGEAVALLEQALATAASLGDRVAMAEDTRRLAEVHLRLGDPARALEQARRALAIAETIGSRVQAGGAHRMIGEAVAAGGAGGAESGRAGEHFKRAIDILAGVKNDLELARCYRAWAGVRERAGEAEEAALLRHRADEIFTRLRGAAATE